MVGFEVTPRTCWSATRDARFPVDSRSRLMSSSQIDTPRSVSWARVSLGEVISVTPTRAPSRWPACPGHTGHGRLRDPFCGDAEFGVQLPIVSGLAEMFQADAHSGVAHVPAPAQRNARLDADPGPHSRRQDVLTVGLVLLGEPLQARHRHDSRRDAALAEAGAGGEGNLDLTARRDEDHAGRAAVRLGQDIAAAR